MKDSEIAKELGISRKQVYQIIHNALKKLRKNREDYKEFRRLVYERNRLKDGVARF